jgi:hypothetical protein
LPTVPTPSARTRLADSTEGRPGSAASAATNSRK